MAGAGGSVGVATLCGEANEKPDMAFVMGVADPCCGFLVVGLGVVILAP
jgi:hypothetical protein